MRNSIPFSIARVYLNLWQQLGPEWLHLQLYAFLLAPDLVFRLCHQCSCANREVQDLYTSVFRCQGWCIRRQNTRYVSRKRRFWIEWSHAHLCISCTGMWSFIRHQDEKKYLSLVRSCLCIAAKKENHQWAFFYQGKNVVYVKSQQLWFNNLHIAL